MTVGQLPEKGQRLIDGEYILGLAGGVNRNFQSLTAKAGGGQASATLITAALVEARVAATGGDSVALPKATAGTEIKFANNGAASVDVFSTQSTATTDTINGTIGTTAYAVGNGVSVSFFCPRDGIWNAIKSA